MRAEFILELHKDMKKIQVEGKLDKEVRSLIEDIRKHLREDTEDLETNHQLIGMRYLFHIFSIKAWNRRHCSNNNCGTQGRYAIVVNKSASKH